MTNFEWITQNEKTLAEYIDIVSVNCYVCGRKGHNNACEQINHHPVAFCTPEFLEWLKQERE